MPEKVEKNEHGKILMSWDFPEYVQYQRTVSWYIGAAVVTLGILLYAIFTANFLFALIVIMMAAIIMIYNLKKPSQIK